jgi:hypothetical protein
MARLNINIGTTANDRTGDPLRTAFEKVNANFIELYTRTGDDIQIPALAGNNGKVLTTNGTTLSWAATDKIVSGSNEITLNILGALVYPRGALQRDIGSITCQGNSSTVVYTVSGQYQHTIKLLIQVEGTEGASAILDTQACEMIIAKSFRADDIAASVYGIVYTSVEPLATFTALWNALTNRIEVLCTTPGANSVVVKIFATEISTSD